MKRDMGVSENNGTPKSSILIGFSIINHPFGVPLFLETPTYKLRAKDKGITRRNGWGLVGGYIHILWIDTSIHRQHRQGTDTNFPVIKGTNLR